MMMMSTGFEPCADTDTPAIAAVIPASKKHTTLRT
jgi:hypothetical protein